MSDPTPIDVRMWKRREQYELFRGFGFPYLSLTAEVDVAPLRRIARQEMCTFTVALLYALSRTANEIPAFRQRIRGSEVVEHAVIHPSVTVLSEDQELRFATLRHHERFGDFVLDATDRIEQAKRSATLWLEPDRDDFLYMTAIPWVSFSAMLHPVPLDPPDSVPRFAWGRFRELQGRAPMPLNIQGHHAVLDGIHMGQYFERIQTLIDAFATVL